MANGQRPLQLAAMTKRVGLIVGREWSFPPAFIDEVARRDAGVVAEMVSIGAVAMDQPCPWEIGRAHV